MSSTSFKLVGGLSAKDATIFAREMGCAPEFLQTMRKRQNHTEFACFVRNHTEHPLRLRVPFGRMEARPRLPASDRDVLLAANRNRISAGTPTLHELQTHKPGDGLGLAAPELV